MQIDRYLLRCCAQINPQRIIDTPAVNLCSRLVSILSICKKANGKRLFRTDKDVGGSNQQRCFCGAKTRVQKLTRRSIFERAMDGGGSKQNRVRTANSQLKNEHGRSFFSVPAGVFCTLLASAPPIFKKVNGERPSERTRMSVKLSSSEFAPQTRR